MTGILASLSAAGCGIGGMTSVPVIGLLQSTAPTAMVWAVLGLAGTHVLVFGAMTLLAMRMRRRLRDEKVGAKGNDNAMEVFDD